MGRIWESSGNCWADLPSDIMLMILMKLRTFELLEFVQFVCQWWYYMCKDPSLWRTINVSEVDQHEYFIDYKKMLRNAVDRSNGGLTDLNIQRFCYNDIFPYVASRSSQLKRLRLAYFSNISAKALTEAIVKLSSLVELELTVCSFHGNADYESIPIVIKSCPFLTTFKFNKSYGRRYECDEVALAIGGNMPELRHLQLIGNDMTNDGLTAILDGCPRLQSLDLRGCSHLFLEGNLGMRLSEQIKDFWGPKDSSENYFYIYSNNIGRCTCNFCNRISSDEISTNAYSDVAYIYSNSDRCTCNSCISSDEISTNYDYYDFEDDEVDISYTGFGNNHRGKLKKHRSKNLKKYALI